MKSCDSSFSRFVTIPSRHRRQTTHYDNSCTHIQADKIKKIKSDMQIIYTDKGCNHNSTTADDLSLIKRRCRTTQPSATECAYSSRLRCAAIGSNCLHIGQSWPGCRTGRSLVQCVFPDLALPRPGRSLQQ